MDGTYLVISSRSCTPAIQRTTSPAGLLLLLLIMAGPVCKGRRSSPCAAAAGDPEEVDAWQEPSKKTRVWGGVVTVSDVGLRSHLSSFFLLVLVMFVVTAAVTATTRNSSSSSDDAAAAEPPSSTMQPPPPPTAVPISSGAAVHEPPATTTMTPPRPTGGAEECDLSSGRWVYDEQVPLYEESACRFMSENLACGKYGRTDLRYQHWRWQPHGCNLPRFDAARLLEKLRGKRLAFVGDSLNRNQWVSMVCLIDTATPGIRKTLSSTGSLTSFKIHEYNASVEFYWSPLLVESNSDHPEHHRVANRTVRAASITKHARHWTAADVLVFNSYLWWRQRRSMRVLWGSFDAAAATATEDSTYGVYKVIDSLRAYELALRTWADWLEFHADRARTRLFFMTMSPTHLLSGEWASTAGAGAEEEEATNHKCYNETEPIAAGGYHRGSSSAVDPAFARAVEEEVARLAARGVAVRLVNVTRLSEQRKDAHPSVHRRQWDPITAAQERDPSSYADCIHWCLPGVPDVWNQLLYAHLVVS